MQPCSLARRFAARATALAGSLGLFRGSVTVPAQSQVLLAGTSEDSGEVTPALATTPFPLGVTASMPASAGTIGFSSCALVPCASMPRRAGVRLCRMCQNCDRTACTMRPSISLLWYNPLESKLAHTSSDSPGFLGRGDRHTATKGRVLGSALVRPIGVSACGSRTGGDFLRIPCL